jgi:hypothetical protein
MNEIVSFKAIKAIISNSALPSGVKAVLSGSVARTVAVEPGPVTKA